MKRALITIFSVLIIDQFLKIWIKTSFEYGDMYPVLGSWFNLHFIENEGMAFGLSFGGEWGKLFLSLFRIVAIFLIGKYLLHFIRIKVHKGFIICSSLVFAGALGNLLDSAFYGLLFTDSGHGVASFDIGNGYAPFLFGKVVDMLYFPLFTGQFPEWIPFWGGEYFEFFRPIFNIADAAISIGITIIIIRQKTFFSSIKENTGKISSNSTEDAEPITENT